MLVDDLTGMRGKSTTTVTMDFGRRTLAGPRAVADVVLYLFGAPGQERFRPIMTDLARGASGALVMADARHPEGAFDSLALVEDHHLPYAVAVNQFPGAPAHPEEELREAFALDPPRPSWPVTRGNAPRPSAH